MVVPPCTCMMRPRCAAWRQAIWRCALRHLSFSAGRRKSRRGDDRHLPVRRNDAMHLCLQLPTHLSPCEPPPCKRPLTPRMDIVQASFQASFDSRVDRLSDVDLDDLRVIFRYFDTDGDGAVSADQACRMFAMLGLDVNTTQVRELGEVYLNEFMKIVDSHVHVAPVASEVHEAVEATAQEGNVAAPQIPDPSVVEAESKLQNEKAMEIEWKLLDTYRRGRVSMQELRLFLTNCHSTLSVEDTERFFETYGNTIENDGSEELELTKEGFLKFRREYTSRKISLSDYDSSSDDEGDLVGNADTKEKQVPDDQASSDANPTANGANSPIQKRLQSRHAERGPSDKSSDHVLSSMDHELVVNPDELVESDESEGEAATNNQNISNRE